MPAKSPAKKRSMHGDEHRYREECGPCVRVKLMTVHRSHRRYGKHEVKATDADRPALDQA